MDEFEDHRVGTLGAAGEPFAAKDYNLMGKAMIEVSDTVYASFRDEVACVESILCVCHIWTRNH